MSVEQRYYLKIMGPDRVLLDVGPLRVPPSVQLDDRGSLHVSYTTLLH